MSKRRAFRVLPTGKHARSCHTVQYVGLRYAIVGSNPIRVINVYSRFLLFSCPMRGTAGRDHAWQWTIAQWP
jgi:hypothetical protein